VNDASMAAMRIDQQKAGDVTILTISGDFDAHTAPQANECLDELIKGLHSKLVFNLGGVDIVTSTAIGFLVDAAKRTRRLGGDVVLIEPQPLFRKTLDMLKIGDYFQAFASHAEAATYFRDRTMEDTVNPTKEPKQKGWFGGKKG